MSDQKNQDCFSKQNGQELGGEQNTAGPMIICHCQSISDDDIHAAIDWMRASDPDVLITPGKIYRSLGKSADCGGCLPLFLSTMRNNDNLGIPAELRDLRPAQQKRGI